MTARTRVHSTPPWLVAQVLSLLESHGLHPSACADVAHAEVDISVPEAEAARARRLIEEHLDELVEEADKPRRRLRMAPFLMALAVVAGAALLFESAPVSVPEPARLTLAAASGVVYLAVARRRQAAQAHEGTQP